MSGVDFVWYRAHHSSTLTMSTVRCGEVMSASAFLLLALALNFVAVCDLFTSKTYVSPGVYWILVLSVVNGILCVLPSAILFDSVACDDYGSEMRFGYL